MDIEFDASSIVPRHGGVLGRTSPTGGSPPAFNRYRHRVAIDVTDPSFEQDVLAVSDDHPVIVDLWAPWCGPCKTLGPIIERVVEETGGTVTLAKVNVDESPTIAASFQVQSVPAVYALSKRKVVDGFVGAISEREVREFVGRLTHNPSEADLLVEKGDEGSLRLALTLEPDHRAAIVALGEMLVGRGDHQEALELLARIPESPETRHLVALARLSESDSEIGDLNSAASIEQRLDSLLDRVKNDDGARQEFLDLLEALDLEDPRRTSYRRALASRIY